MEPWQAALLGLVEGLTEYLPVSSTGHLLLTQRAMGLEGGSDSNAFAICIQLGAILAVFALYRSRVAQMLRGIAGREAVGRRLFVSLCVAFVPAAIIGYLFDDKIEEHLFGLWPVAIAWLAGGAFLLWLSQRKLGQQGRSLESMAWTSAAIIGLCQCAAMWPGVSRSLATIAGGLLCGLSFAAAIEFSFLLGLLTLGAATAYKGLQHGSSLVENFGVLNLAIGLSVAFIAAILSVKWMVRSLNSRSLAFFGGYRIVLSMIVAVALIKGILKAV